MGSCLVEAKMVRLRKMNGIYYRGGLFREVKK